MPEIQTGSVQSILETSVLWVRLYNMICGVLWFKKKESLITEGENRVSLSAVGLAGAYLCYLCDRFPDKLQKTRLRIEHESETK